MYFFDIYLIFILLENLENIKKIPPQSESSIKS